jgi:hypothetical protein
MNLATLVSNEVQGTKAIPTIKELRKELQAKSGAPCSPKMSMASIILKLNELASQPQINDDANVVIKTKATKPQGIGNKILELLKSGVSPKETLETIQATFEGCKTTMACVYWYKSKINQGLM